VLKIVENRLVVGAPPEPRWGAHIAPRLAGGKGLAAPPEEPARLLAFGLDFRPLGLILQSFPNSLHFPPMLRGLDKTLHSYVTTAWRYKNLITIIHY